MWSIFNRHTTKNMFQINTKQDCEFGAYRKLVYFHRYWYSYYAHGRQYPIRLTDNFWPASYFHYFVTLKYQIFLACCFHIWFIFTIICKNKQHMKINRFIVSYNDKVYTCICKLADTTGWKSADTACMSLQADDSRKKGLVGTYIQTGFKKNKNKTLVYVFSRVI